MLNYSSAVIDKVDISCVSDLSGGQFVIKTRSGNLAMTDSYNNVSFATYVTGSANQQWELTPDTVRMQNEIKFSSLDIEYPLSNGSTIITSGYGMRIYGTHQFHSGLDISATRNTPLYAVFDGEIIDKSDTPSGDRGRYITIRSNNLYYNNVSVTIIVNYYHLQSVTELGVGDTVTANDFIGRVGGSGYNQDNAYSPHLHITFSTDYNEQGRYVEQSDTFNPLWIYRDKIFGSNSTTDEIPGVIE